MLISSFSERSLKRPLEIVIVRKEVMLTRFGTSHLNTRMLGFALVLCGVDGGDGYVDVFLNDI